MPLMTVSPMHTLYHPLLEQRGIDLHVLRLDKLAPPISGNKYFKLKYNIEFAKAKGYQRLLSFGGAFSNHIHALAMAGQVYGMKTIGFIRGDPGAQPSATLQDAVAAGMELQYLSRDRYKLRHSSELLAELQALYPDAHIIPEGGSNDLGVKGCVEIVDQIKQHLNNDFDMVCLPCGTAATLAGVAAGLNRTGLDGKGLDKKGLDKKGLNKTEKTKQELNKSQRVLGFSVLKNAHYLDAEVSRYLTSFQPNGDQPTGDSQNWQIMHQFHCGGYAKVNAELAHFIERFEQRFNLPLEPVYTGKMFFGLHRLLLEASPLIPQGSRVVAVHTGGLQGLRGMQSTLQRLRTTTARHI